MRDILKHLTMRRFIVIWIALLALAQLNAARRDQPGRNLSRLDKVSLESYARQLYMWESNIRVTVSDLDPSEFPGLYAVRIVGATDYTREEQTLFVTRDGRRALQGPVYDLTEGPFQAERKAIESGTNPAYGPANAPVHVVVFFDFQCKACAEHAALIRRKFAADYPNDVRVTVRDLPLVELHDWARTAAIAGRCVFWDRPEAFWGFYDSVFEQQDQLSSSNILPSLRRIWSAEGLDSQRMESCLNSKNAALAVEQSVKFAHTLSVNGTPTTFVNGRRLQDGASWWELKRAVDFALQRLKTPSAADCNCSPDNRTTH